MAHFSLLVIGENRKEQLDKHGEHWTTLVQNNFMPNDREKTVKWDDYIIGGAWSEHLVLKNGELTYMAFKKDILFPIKPTFAVLFDGTWYQKGILRALESSKTMKSNLSWKREFESLINSVNDDTLFTVYDCHI